MPQTSPCPTCPSCSLDLLVVLLRTGSLGISPGHLLGSPPFATPRASHFLLLSLLQPFLSFPELSLFPVFPPHPAPLCSLLLPGWRGVLLLPPLLWLKQLLPTPPQVQHLHRWDYAQEISHITTGTGQPWGPHCPRGTGKGKSPWEKLWMCSSAQAAGGRHRELRAVPVGCWRANTSPETSLTVLNTYLYKAEAALFSPLGLLGLGSPAMLMSAGKGHTAVTWHIPDHLHPSWARSWAGCTQPCQRDMSSSTPPTHSHLLLACLGPAGAPQEGE